MSAVTIKESRRLLLPLETVLEALMHFDRRSNGPLSRGDVLQADFVTDQVNGQDGANRLEQSLWAGVWITSARASGAGAN